MAKAANTNEPTEEDVQDAVSKIEKCHDDLLKERMDYMRRCKPIHEIKRGHYDIASEKGISKKLLKLKIKERASLRKIAADKADLEPDERNEFEMLSSKLGDFINTPLGQAAAAKAQANDGGLPNFA